MTVHVVGAVLTVLLSTSCTAASTSHSEEKEVTSPCSESARGKDLHMCLQALRKRAEDPSLFWFGTSYRERCEEGEEGAGHRADCYNPRHHHGPDSLLSRLLALSQLPPDTLDRYLTVTYTTQPGSYKGCEHQLTYHTTREVTLDPLSTTVMTPYEVRAQPGVSWQADDNDVFTLMLYDAGYMSVNALHLNIPGSNLTEGQTVVEYEGPLNPTRNNNPIVFLLFRQRNHVALGDKWTQLLARGQWQAELQDFLEEHHLEGPVALSWVLVTGDLYGAEVTRARGFMNTCAHFIADAFQKEQIEFLDKETEVKDPQQLSVYVNVTLEATPTMVNSCCSLHSYPARTFNLNPLGDALVLPAHARNDVTLYVTLHLATAFPDTQRDFGNKTLTLAMVDPDVPVQAFGNPQLPFLHWLVTNIRGGDVASGHVVQAYMGPAPPDSKPHRYYFLVFLQDGDLDPAVVDHSALNCSWDFRGRCRFNVTSLIDDHDLQLVGVTWMRTKFDEFVRHLYVQAGVTPRCSACHGVPGYANPCPSLLNTAAVQSVAQGISLAVAVAAAAVLLLL